MNARERLTAKWDRRIDRLQEEIAIGAESIIQNQLDEWARRFPRHSFSAWDSMGVFALEVAPPVLGQSFIDHLGHDTQRGAIGALQGEARALIDWYNTFDERLSISIQTLNSQS